MNYGLRRIETNDTLIGQVVNPDLSGKVKVIDRTASNFLKSHEYTELFNSDPIDIQDRLFDDKKAELFAEELKKKDDISIDYINQRIKEDQAAKRTKKQKAAQSYSASLLKSPDVIDSMAAAATDPINIKIPSSDEDKLKPKVTVSHPQMYDISGGKGNKTQTKKEAAHEKAQSKALAKAHAKKEADDSKQLKKETKALEKEKAKELTVKERVQVLEGGATMAQKVASAAVSGVKKLGSLASAGVQHLSSASSSSVQPRDTSLLYGDGTGRKDFYTPNTQPRDTSLLLGDGTGKKYFHTNSTKSKARAQAKASKTMDDEYENLMKDVGKNMTTDEKKLFEEMTKKKQRDPILNSKTKYKSSSPPVIQSTTGLKAPPAGQIPPSRIGIQKLREELENAKNKGKLDVQDTSAYMKMYDDWKAAKGDKALKDEKLKGLREIYKRVLYTK